MPANIMLRTNAKITALVCSGRNRPKLSHAVPKLSWKKLSCEATSTPTNMPTTPQTRVASRNWRTIWSLNSRVILRADTVGKRSDDGDVMSGVSQWLECGGVGDGERGSWGEWDRKQISLAPLLPRSSAQLLLSIAAENRAHVRGAGGSRDKAASVVTTGHAVGGRIEGRPGVRKGGRFLREREQRVAFRAADAAARLLAKEEHHKGEDRQRLIVRVRGTTSMAQN